MKKNKQTEALYNAFLRCSEGGWKDDEVYQEYAKLVAKYLGKNADDKLEQGRVTLYLSLVKLRGWNND